MKLRYKEEAFLDNLNTWTNLDDELQSYDDDEEEEVAESACACMSYSGRRYRHSSFDMLAGQIWLSYEMPLPLKCPDAALLHDSKKYRLLSERRVRRVGRWLAYLATSTLTFGFKFCNNLALRYVGYPTRPPRGITQDDLESSFSSCAAPLWVSFSPCRRQK